MQPGWCWYAPMGTSHGVATDRAMPVIFLKLYAAQLDRTSTKTKTRREKHDAIHQAAIHSSRRLQFVRGLVPAHRTRERRSLSEPAHQVRGQIGRAHV